MNITPMTTALTVSSMDDIRNFVNYINSNPICKDAVMVDFKEVDATTVNMDYAVVQTSPTASKDYCFSGLMYCREGGYFYYYPEYVNTLIPMIHVPNFFNNCVQKVFGKSVQVPKVAIDNFFQNVKLGGALNKQTPLNELLNECLNYYTATKQRTIIGKLLYDEVDTSTVDSHATIDDFRKFFGEFNKTVLQLIELFVKATKSITNASGLLGTYVSVCDSTSEVLESDTWKKVKYMVDNDKSSLEVELGTNIIFNPTARTYIDQLIDTSSKDGFTTNRDVEKNYDAAMIVLNATDFIDTPEYKLYSTAQNLGVDINNYDPESDDFSVSGTKLLRLRQIQNLEKSYSANTLGSSDISKVLDDISDDPNSELIDPSVYVLPTRMIKDLSTIFRKFR